MGYFAGIDPGASGAIALLSEYNRSIVAFKLSNTEDEISDFLRSYRSQIYFCLMEQVHAFPARDKDDPTKITQGITSTFTFGQNYGFLRGILSALKIPRETITPRKWQKALGCLTGGNKNVTKVRAQELYPDFRVTLWNADAILIAHLCKIMNSNLIISNWESV